MMTEDACLDENDSLRLQNLGGGVSCYYYTDPKQMTCRRAYPMECQNVTVPKFSIWRSRTPSGASDAWYEMQFVRNLGIADNI
jgi:hypothetical protein